MLYLSSCNKIYSQPSVPISDDSQIHELTVFVIRSILPLNWESPSTLFKSYRKEISAKPLRKQKSMMGHTFVLLRSPLVSDSIFAGMTYVSKKTQRKLVIKDKIGLGVLGMYMEGRMQPHDELNQKMFYYASKGEVSFIRYRINESAAKRVIDFYNSYISPFDNEKAKCDFYGGAFWPRYDFEGSGCSAFGFACLEVAQVLEEFSGWKKSVVIPMDLIGGEINNSKKIRVRDIKKSKSWYKGNGIPDKDFVQFDIFDPSAVYEWINIQRQLPVDQMGNGYSPTEMFGIPGVFADRTNVAIDSSEPVLKHRETENIFIRYFYKKTGIRHIGEITTR